MPRRALRVLLFLAVLPGAAAAQEMACPQFQFEDAASPAATGDPGKLVITADQAELTQGGQSTLEGTVHLKLGDNEFQAQSLHYDEPTRHVRVDGESVFRGKNLVIRSETAEFDLARETGWFNHSEFTLVQRAARGGARHIELSRDGTARIENVYYTTCAPGSRAWFLEASEIELDQEEGLGTAHHARLRFGYVPILYAPWFRFPIDDRRRTGFLFPTVGQSDRTGIDFRIPVYLNLAPNYDAQLIPRYMARRGAQLGSQGRYLLTSHRGEANYEYLDNDQERDARRTYLDFRHEGLINRRLALNARYGRASDPEYFEDLGGRIESASITHLERSARLTYAAPAAYSITGRVTDYQTVARNLDPNFDPYRREPELRVMAITPKAWRDVRAGFTGEYVNFARDLPAAATAANPQGQRLDLDPYLRFQRDELAWYLGSQLDWRYTQYRVSGTADADLERALPTFSAEGGLRFDRTTSGGQLQTLEPRLFYLKVPYRNQDTLPVFDSGEPDFDFVQLFSRNRFSGEDRISDADHLATTFTSRLLNPEDGYARMSFSLGQIYRFEQPRVIVNQPGFSTTTPDRGATDFLVEGDYRPIASLALAASGQWSPDTGEFVRVGYGARYLGERLRADVGYRYRSGIVVSNPAAPGTTQVSTLEQADASAIVPVWGGLSTIGRVRYSLAEDRTLDALGGVEYQTCCWAVRGAYRRYQFSFEETAPFDPRYTTGVYLQLELTGLTRIGAGFQSLLPTLEE